MLARLCGPQHYDCAIYLGSRNTPKNFGWRGLRRNFANFSAFSAIMHGIGTMQGGGNTVQCDGKSRRRSIIIIIIKDICIGQDR